MTSDIKPTNRVTEEQALSARRVLIINVTRIGDTLLNTPAIRAIAKRFPNASITVLGHEKRVEVLANIPYIAKIGSISKKSAPFRARFTALTGNRYDWAFVWGNDAALHRYALRKARNVVTYRQVNDDLSPRFFCAAEGPALYSMHGVAMQLALPRSVGIDADQFHLDYVVTSTEQVVARARLDEALGGQVKRPLIGLQVASFPTKAYRDWPIGNFIALAKRVVTRYPDAVFIMFGGPDDVAKIEAFRVSFLDRCIVFAGALTLRETVAVMNEIDLYIGVDTGPTHLYGALGKPMVVMYHASLPSALYKPLSHPALYVVDHPHRGEVSASDAETISMDELSVESVWGPVHDALEGKVSMYPGMPPSELAARPGR
jgi:heptosyltransferase III